MVCWNIPAVNTGHGDATGPEYRLFQKAMDTWNSVNSGAETGEDKGPSNSELSGGFKDALTVGAEKAVKLASKPGGFLDNPEIRIPLPGQLETVASAMRKLGMGSKVDQFEESMNHAAEKASAAALPIFMDAIKGITFEDAKKLLNGGDTAITEFFKEKTSSQLAEAFKPIVHQSVQEVGVTKRYQELTGSPWMKNLVKESDFDLDNYVTSKSLDGLFHLLSQQEKEIRHNPAARTTELLKKVFGGR
jgi:hypothetical protein